MGISEAAYLRKLERNRKRARERRAARAIAEGREPGVRGNPKRFKTEEERQAAYKARQQRYLEKHRDRRRASWRAYRKKKLAAKAIAEGRPVGHVGALPKYTEEERRERRRLRTAAWRRANLEKAREVARRSAKISYQKHKENWRARRVAYRARKLNSVGRHTGEDIKNLLIRQKGRCAFCLGSLNGKYHVDHYLPLSRGGSNDISNLRLLHPKCNQSKYAKHPLEFALQNGLLCW